ncbi:hypothetical protein Tco_0275944 [Tanacetum coccineum]
MLLAMKDEAGSNLKDEENDFLLDNSYVEETMKELTAVVMLMARIQPADGNAETVPSYDANAVSEVNASSKVHEHVTHVKCKTIIQTSDDDQIDSNIIFNDPYVENNGGTSAHDSNAHDEYHEIQMLAYNVQRETENKKQLNNELKKQKELLQKELETYIVNLEEKPSSHDRIVYKMGQSIQAIHMLGKKPNKVYDPFLKAGLGYKNPERLKKAIATQPKMYDGKRLHSAKLTIDSPDSEETLEDVKESRLKMRNKMVQINYGKLNALYETFVPQQEFSVEQTYFSIPSTSNNGYESKEVTSDLPIPKMPKESKLLKMFDTMGVAINGLRTRIDKTHLEDRQRRWMSDSQNSLREYNKTDVILMSASLSKNLKELKEELIEEVQVILNIFESMERKVNRKSSKENILQNEIDRLLEVSLTSEIRNCVLIFVEKQKNELLKAELKEKSSGERPKIGSQAQSIDFELKLQHQKEKTACDVSWKSKLSTINDENVLLKTQVDYVVKERENIKLEYQKLFNSIKATQTQHQKELDELIEHVNQKTHAYADVRAQNQDLLKTISKLKNKLQIVDKGKNVNTKFDKSKTSGTLLCVTPLPKNIAVKDKKVSNTKVNTYRSKPVTSHLTPKNEQSRKYNENVLARGMYRITKIETQTPDSKTNINVCNSTGVESSNSVRRPKSKDTKSKDRVLKNNNDKRPSAHVRKMSSSVSIDSNKCETMHSNVCQSNASVLSTKTVNAVNDGSNIVFVSCGKGVFLLSYGKCVARYALSSDAVVVRLKQEVLQLPRQCT